MHRTFVLLTAAILSALSALPAGAQSSSRSASVPRVQAPAGRLRGRHESGIHVWQGIPYAAPPVGARRWQPPQPLAPWPGERDATRPGPVCLQSLTLPGAAPQIRGAEDCLTLNIVAPAGARKAPVMVWLHGGSFQFGAGSDYDLRVLAREQGVVTVSVNYRLGALGFLATPGLVDRDGNVGNYGLQDQQQALKWIKANIAAFGGDPGNVTLFGESAGGMSICAQLASPGARGLFQRAIIQSGPCNAPGVLVSRAQALGVGVGFARASGCRPEDAQCLRAIPAAKLIRTPLPGLKVTGLVPFPPHHGDGFLPRAPLDAARNGLMQRVPVLIGSNREEGRFFTAWLGGAAADLSTLEYVGLQAIVNGENAPRVLLNYNQGRFGSRALAAAAAITDGLFACPTNDLARALTPYVPVYSYEFRDPQPPHNFPASAGTGDYGAFHTSEIVSVLGTPLSAAPLPGNVADPGQFSAAQAALARSMRQAWGNFARRGNPNGPGVPQWSPLDARQNNLLGLHPAGSVVFSDFRREHRCDDVWRP